MHTYNVGKHCLESGGRIYFTNELNNVKEPMLTGPQFWTQADCAFRPINEHLYQVSAPQMNAELLAFLFIFLGNTFILKPQIQLNEFPVYVFNFSHAK